MGDVNSGADEVKLAEEFNAAHPDIEVKFEPIPSEGYGTKLTTSLAAGQAPDVFLVGEGDYFKYVDKGVIEPLDDYLSKDTSFNLDIFQKDLIENMKIDGKQYYLPKDFNPLALWYNKRMFDEAGIPYPTDEWTWDDMIATAQKLTKKDGNKYTQFGFNAGKWEYPIYTYLWDYGTDIASEDGTTAEGYMNSEKTIAAMEQYVSWSKGDNRVSPTPLDSETLGGDSSMFMTDKLAMMITGRWIKGDLDKSDVQYGSALIPKNTDGTRSSIIASAGWAVNAAGKNKEAAYELVKWLSGTDAQKLRSANGKVLPATVKELDAVKAKEVADKPVIEMMDYAKNRSRCVLPMDLYLLRNLPRRWRKCCSANRMSRVLWMKLRRTLTAKSSKTMQVSRRPCRFTFFIKEAAMRNSKSERAGYWFIMPWFVGLLLFTIGPMLFSLLLAFSKWDIITGVKSIEWVGLDNFKTMFHDELFYQSLKVTFIFALVSVPLYQAASLLIALMLNMRNKGMKFFRLIYFMPSVIPAVAASMMWIMIFNPEYGILNRALAFSVCRVQPGFKIKLCAGCIDCYGFVGHWQHHHHLFVRLARRSRGAVRGGEPGWCRTVSTVFNITLPMISPTVFFNVIMGIIGGFQYFTQAFVMTNGGPLNSTLFYNLYLYNKAFTDFEMGYASALSWVLFIIILAFTLLVIRSSSMWVYYQGDNEKD